jgi:hypothetical protein
VFVLSRSSLARRELRVHREPDLDQVFRLEHRRRVGVHALVWRGRSQLFTWLRMSSSCSIVMFAVGHIGPGTSRSGRSAQPALLTVWMTVPVHVFVTLPMRMWSPTCTLGAGKVRVPMVVVQSPARVSALHRALTSMSLASRSS